MSLFASPEIHAANGPETWTVKKQDGGRNWVIVTNLLEEEGYRKGQQVEMGWSYSTKREATADIQPDGRWGRLYAQESDWYAGGQGQPGWKPYSVVKVEQEASAKKRAEAKRKEERKTERMGVTVETVESWDESMLKLHRSYIHPGFNDGEPITDDIMESVQEALDAMREMLSLLQGQTLLAPDELTKEERTEWKRELIAQDGNADSLVTDYIDRIKYHGLDADRPALEILEEIEAAA